ncbi:MAG: hypothetical protein HOQ17_03695 [Gemmatimonadaceae bacterium]|nr:hypothetical protein [Gemmatimonadaceae bacterium]NUO94900.1 hypothetical protein [Gemmatimonadaceae bacterium]NUP55897.1 hypothetical protein [Gemmatimonadaceae bacterium]NUP72209.1 hypothetical protein [Gemmatimonadaceae bacterium]NUR34691.1 hypothetical protein [Gemmatimonadaceae bacterium]
MSGGLLEATLLGACPGLRERWESIRRMHGSRVPDDGQLLTQVRLHVVELLAGGRVAEFTRFARAVERLLGEADPILADLLETQLIRPLAEDVEGARVSPSLVTPHLGPRLRASWPYAP